MRAELVDLDDRPGHDDEVQFESPGLLDRSQEIGERSISTLRVLVEERRRHAQNPTVLVLPNKNCPELFAAHPGYTLVHHETGIMASFYVEASGLGCIVAKSYSNPLLDDALLPPERRRPMPKHFYGYGVGRRLYLAAHSLWPHIRWQDGAVRSTSRALRSRLHSMDPYVWQDRDCCLCRLVWGDSASREEIISLHGTGCRASPEISWGCLDVKEGSAR